MVRADDRTNVVSGTRRIALAACHSAALTPRRFGTLQDRGTAECDIQRNLGDYFSPSTRYKSELIARIT